MKIALRVVVLIMVLTGPTLNFNFAHKTLRTPASEGTTVAEFPIPNPVPVPLPPMLPV